ncbi:MAG TPA: hypothetical protein VKM54_20400 [Myxococcota bacterium]|nr:hypothetical protein [Myxococcota bacterium]
MLARRKGWRHARRLFLACILGSAGFVAPRGVGGVMVYAGTAVEILGIPIALALTLRLADELSAGRETPLWRRVLP